MALAIQKELELELEAGRGEGGEVEKSTTRRGAKKNFKILQIFAVIQTIDGSDRRLIDF